MIKYIFNLICAIEIKSPEFHPPISESNEISQNHCVENYQEFFSSNLYSSCIKVNLPHPHPPLFSHFHLSVHRSISLFLSLVYLTLHLCGTGVLKPTLKGTIELDFHFSFFTTDITSRACYKTDHVGRILILYPKLNGGPKFHKWGMTKFPEWGTKFPEWGNRFLFLSCE